jgi:hypothetical protein
MVERFLQLNTILILVMQFRERHRIIFEIMVLMLIIQLRMKLVLAKLIVEGIVLFIFSLRGRAELFSCGNVHL